MREEQPMDRAVIRFRFLVSAERLALAAKSWGVSMEQAIMGLARLSAVLSRRSDGGKET